MKSEIEIVVIISANIEWMAVLKLFPTVKLKTSPFGEYFQYPSKLPIIDRKIIVFHGGWGKISAAASSQYAIDRWKPKLLINLGTCGGFKGNVERGTIILVERTIVYDIFEQMGDHAAHIAHYTTDFDLSWLEKPYPEEVMKTLIVSGDRDLMPKDVKKLNNVYGAVAGDWESGAIAYVADRNRVPCLILRGVSDLVSDTSGEAYENISLFEASAMTILNQLMKSLPSWIAKSNVFND